MKTPSHRAEQLRRAQRAQRERDAAAGLVPCQVKLRPETARKLRAALAVPGGETALAELLDEAIVDARDYPSLRALLWNRADSHIPARHAFALYERNWRLVDTANLTQAERALIERLTQRFGDGLLNA
jgi:hypothetical protein